jgi:hypothetical protein
VPREDTETDPDILPPGFEDSVVIIDKPLEPDPTPAFAVTFRPPPTPVTIYIPVPRLGFARATRPPTDERD